MALQRPREPFGSMVTCALVPRRSLRRRGPGTSPQSSVASFANHRGSRGAMRLPRSNGSVTRRLRAPDISNAKSARLCESAEQRFEARYMVKLAVSSKEQVRVTFRVVSVYVSVPEKVSLALPPSLETTNS